MISFLNCLHTLKSDAELYSLMIFQHVRKRPATQTGAEARTRHRHTPQPERKTAEARMVVTGL